MNEPELASLDMVCTCRVEGVRESEARRLKIYLRMGSRFPMQDLVTAVILSLGFDFQAEAFELGADMWFGLYVKTPFGDVEVQCDSVGDGLMAVWEHLAEAHPERVVFEARENPVIERISAGMLGWYESADGEYRAHRAAAHEGPNDCPPCEDCAVGRNLVAIALVTLQDAWGEDALTLAVEAAYS